jgi:hypothetical protein
MKVLKAPQSGSLAGITAGRNRFGQYERTRAIPVNPASVAQGAVRARLSTNSAAYRGLTSEQRAGWESLGNQMTRTDSLGQTYTLQGNQAYASVNNTRDLADLELLSDAPALSTPSAVAAIELEITPASFSLAYAPSPVPAGSNFAIFAGPIRSAGRKYEGDFRFMVVEPAAGATPLDIINLYAAKFGAPTVGSRIFVSLVNVGEGFMSTALIASEIVIAA